MPEAKEHKIGQPDPFDGSRDKLRGFLISVDLYTAVNRAIYDTDEKKFGKDENGSMQLGEYKEFQAAIEGSFLEMDMTGSAITKLRYLKQTKTADEYI
ncbi:hypothetical protein NEOLEDRAFT_1182541 [Neolentinus lepideus HHB14362 ss-1]|uniref:Uncharacterized protein n=1 Tax=Neolentinus lepideus HHB14362 ss-1 TaxID=1314782 RepID=A0A165P3P5_9AGAM|nr:hypothetical protein NEOLEDRAFT_1182541 [Neolentinus lepideus HHB14362 ss-1]